MEKRCLFCGEEFEAINKRQLTCSKLCKSRRERSMNQSRMICQYCGKEFYNKDKKRKFCSHECYGKNKKQLGTTICEHCGKEYILKSRRDNLRFCSNECYHKWRYESSIIEYKCEYCGAVFRKEGKKSFDYVNGKKRIPRFCSKECVDKARIGKYGCENSPQWKGGVCSINDLVRAELKYWKKDVLDFNNYTCFISGERGGRLVSHHIKPFHLIRDEILIELGLDKKACIKDCSDKQYKTLIEKFNKVHTVELGVAINKEIHKLLHHHYGFKATYDDLLAFKQRYKNGEFSEINTLKQGVFLIPKTKEVGSCVNYI